MTHAEPPPHEVPRAPFSTGRALPSVSVEQLWCDTGVSRFAARCLLVAAAIVLAVAGVVVPFPGASRTVLFGAALCCGLLDVWLVRSPREPVHGGDPVLGPPPEGTDDTAGQVVPASAGDTAASSGAAVPTIVLGRGTDGRTIRVLRDQHLVVVGTGALAVAVFRAVAAGIRAPGPATRSRPAVRIAADPELRHALQAEGEPCPALPEDTAALVRVDGAGRPQATVVLVPGLGQLPRRRDTVVHVTRYGCAVDQSAPGATGAAPGATGAAQGPTDAAPVRSFVPALLQLPTPAPSAAAAATSARAPTTARASAPSTAPPRSRSG